MQNRAEQCPVLCRLSQDYNALWNAACGRLRLSSGMGTRGERGFHTSCFGMTVMMGGDSCGDGGDVDEAEDESQFRATIKRAMM